MTSKGNRERCPACGRAITEYLGKGAIYNCPQCRRQFALKWSKSQRDFVFIDLADRGKGEPLNLPRGSVRSIITLSFCVTLWLLIVLGRPAPSFLVDAILIVFSFYFAFRSSGRAHDSGEVVVEKNAKEPLNMPKGSVRWILVAGFALAIFVSLVARGRLEGDYASFLFVLGGIITGYLISKARVRMKVETPMVLQHIKAAIVLAVVLLISAATVIGVHTTVPDIVLLSSMALASYYFSSR